MIISIVNHKGGTGKTTTTINLGSALAAAGQRVLLIDFDAQGSLSYSLGIPESASTIADLLLGDCLTQDVIIESGGMYVLPADRNLADVELAIAKSTERFSHLQQLMLSLPEFDFVLIDCSPSLSLLTLNALAASDNLIIPMQMDVLALCGLDSMLETISKIRKVNQRLEVMGVLPIMADPRKNIYQEILQHIRTNYNVRVFNSVIRASVKVAEAPSFGKSVVDYAPSSTTAMDYTEFAREVLILSKALHDPPITNNK